MANTINGIVNCDISLESPATSVVSTSGLLLVVKGAESSKGEIKYYTDLQTLATDGYTEDTAAYKAAQTAFAQYPKPEGVYLAPVIKEEDPVEAVKRALTVDGWYHILPAGISLEKYNALAVFTETQEKMLGLTLGAEEESPILQTGLMRTHVWRLASNQTGDYDKFLAIAVAAATSSTAPGSETWAYKTLSIINPGVFTSTEVNTMDGKCENYYVQIAKKNVTQVGKVIGDEWCDIIRFRDWLKNQIQMNVFNILVTNDKVPFTDGGITLVENALKAALKAGQNAGGIDTDSIDENGNLLPGYTTYAPLASSFSAAQKKLRKLTGLKWNARLSGAIHLTELGGKLGY